MSPCGTIVRCAKVKFDPSAGHAGRVRAPAPEYLLGPSHAELESHYRAVRHRLLEIPDSEVAVRKREITNVMWNHHGAIKHRERVSVTGIGIGVEQAAEAEKVREPMYVPLHLFGMDRSPEKPWR